MGGAREDPEARSADVTPVPSLQPANPSVSLSPLVRSVPTDARRLRQVGPPAEHLGTPSHRMGGALR